MTAVERFFQVSLLGMLASGYLAVVGSGYLDLPTTVLVAAGLILRALVLAGWVRFTISDRAVTAATIAYVAFYPIDYYWLTREFIPSTVHLIFFLAIAKLLTMRTDRDAFYVKVIAFLELLAAAILSAGLNFFLFLTLFIVFSVATFMASEVRRAERLRRVLPAFPRRLAALALFSTCGILLLTAGLFFVLPRTAVAAFRHLVPERYHLSGFSNEVVLGQIGELKKQGAVVMHVKFSGPEREYRVKWRGTALTEFDGRRWFNTERDAERLLASGGRITFPESNPRLLPYVFYEVQLKPIGPDALFFAGQPESMQIRLPMVLRTPVDGYRLPFHPDGLRYTVYAYLGDPRPDRPGYVERAVPELSPPQRAAALRLPRVDNRLRTLAHTVTAPALNDAQRALLLEHHLRTRYGYTTDLLQSEVNDPLAHFLFDRRKGHCEYFASAMAVLLRLEGIPSRVVTGFQSGVFNPISGWHVIRASDAHSWVEAWLPGRGWVTFDPTPPDNTSPGWDIASRIMLYFDAAETFWQDWVLNYNADRQFNLASSIEQSRRRLNGQWLDRLQTDAAAWSKATVEWLRLHGPALIAALSAAVLTAFLLPWLYRRWQARKRLGRLQRGHAHASDATLLYQRMLALLRRRGLEKPAWITPGEFVRHIPQQETALLVEQITESYNELRFGGRRDAAPRLLSLLTRLEEAISSPPATEPRTARSN
ncbi:MAG: DUF3488 and transglutaminase-like domain-containing protein [Bryobacteraceae bacterium]|nr:DUF3488 and transglutaminase-like domain-containing protein [Bryobacteraceae bacterium]